MTKQPTVSRLLIPMPPVDPRQVGQRKHSCQLSPAGLRRLLRTPAMHPCSRRQCPHAFLPPASRTRGHSRGPAPAGNRGVATAICSPRWDRGDPVPSSRPVRASAMPLHWIAQDRAPAHLHRRRPQPCQDRRLAYRQAGRQDQNFHLRHPSAGSPLILGEFANSVMTWPPRRHRLGGRHLQFQDRSAAFAELRRRGWW